MKNREIKFRVWNGAEMIYDVTVGKFGVFYVNPTNNGLDPKDSASITPFTTKYHDDTPVLQYTGMKDKNGKEIWEGDVIQFTMIDDAHELGVVRFSEGGYWTSQLQGYQEELLYAELNSNLICKVIGNIYEHPNLIKP